MLRLSLAFFVIQQNLILRYHLVGILSELVLMISFREYGLLRVVMPFQVHFVKHFREIHVHVLDPNQELLQVHLLEDDLGDLFHLADVVCQLVFGLAVLETAAHLFEKVCQRILIEDEDPEL